MKSRLVKITTQNLNGPEMKIEADPENKYKKKYKFCCIKNTVLKGSCEFSFEYFLVIGVAVLFTVVKGKEL